jgi:hypothetical protein
MMITMPHIRCTSSVFKCLLRGALPHFSPLFDHGRLTNTTLSPWACLPGPRQSSSIDPRRCIFIDILERRGFTSLLLCLIFGFEDTIALCLTTESRRSQESWWIVLGSGDCICRYYSFALHPMGYEKSDFCHTFKPRLVVLPSQGCICCFSREYRSPESSKRAINTRGEHTKNSIQLWVPHSGVVSD